ncbi:stage II sporulation protein P [Novisyntrophococcus fermenticellae]|uniref:stage II sporulation protein P n=1 Tax=Novisyntrophococcus fermenticellae TaxID=2068655 RepID=UPI001E339482|nr:stage II sporulation protein P [Novisyntrophococcus fermenticellae]
MDRNNKGLGTIVIIVMAAIAVILVYRSYKVITAQGAERGKEILGAAYEQAADLAVKTYIPQVYYENGNAGNGDIFERIVQMAQEQIPGMGAEEEEEGKETEIIEDDSTEAAILEENERVIQAKITAENQQKIQQDSQVQPEQTQKGTDEQVQQTSSFNIVNPISLEQLQDYNFLLNNFFVVDGNTSAEKSEINLDQLWGKDMKISDDTSGPKILIYHTHSQEEFADSVAGDTSTTVIGVGEHLAQILRDTYGYQVLHRTDTFDLVDGRLERSKAYNYAEPVLQQVLAENPSIEVVIDLHRDGVDESKHLVTEIDGKPTAKVMFFNGLSRTSMNGPIDSLPNPYIEDNLAFSFQLEYLAKQCYPDFTRCIYLKGYRYNLHVRPKSILLEVGAQTNTVEEAMNAMEPFAKVLNSVLKGTNKNES